MKEKQLTPKHWKPKMKKKTVKVKGWVLLFSNSICAPRGTNGRKRVKCYLKKSYAMQKALENNATILSVTISYSFPKKK